MKFPHTCSLTYTTSLAYSTTIAPYAKSRPPGPLRVFIGVDQRQPVAYQVAAASIVKHSSVPVAITPLVLRQLPLKRRGLTDFTFSRYLVPYLCGYEGHALFVDADTLCLSDIADLPWDADESVSVVKHTTVTKNGQQVNVGFERPSVMLFNCEQSKRLTPGYIETGTPQKFDEWALSVGELDPAWNYLVGYNTGGGAKLAHFTMGIPIFEETKDDEYAAEWHAVANECVQSCGWADIMGGSVHAKWKQKPAISQFLKHQGFG
jgi:hypothetical protein